MDTTGYTPEEPIAAIATALAPAALGIIRCTGKGCLELVSKLFSRPAALQAAAGNTAIYGWIVDSCGEGHTPTAIPYENERYPERSALGGVHSSTTPSRRIDEVIATVFRAPRSFTGEDMVEISCHGGPAIVTEIFRLLIQNGFREANRGEFTFRAFINGKADLTRAEAVQEIISAKTDESRSRAAGRLAGNLYDLIEGIKSRLVEVLAAIEAEIEYPEDEETIADAFDDSTLRHVESELEQLCATWTSEKLYQDGARIVLCGKTNAGKSSLFNTLLKEERAIVSDIHGTTRDWIESWVSFAGIPARLFDTAGLRQTDDLVERHGVQRTMDLTQDADLMLYVVDATIGLAKEDEEFLREFTQHQNEAEPYATKTTPVILVLNKCDIAGTSVTEQAERIKTDETFHVAAVVQASARTGTGTDELAKTVHNRLTAAATTSRDQPGLGSSRQKQCTSEALQSVRHALQAAEAGYTLDAVVQDIEDALDSLGEITGTVTTEDILDTVFSRFCLGK